MSGRSSDERAAHRAMNQRNPSSAIALHEKLYRQRYGREKEVVECLGEKVGKNRWQTWLGTRNNDFDMSIFEEGEDREKDPYIWHEQKVGVYPLGVMAIRMDEANKRAAEQEELAPKKRGGSTKKKRGAKSAPRYPSDDDFIVPDGVIDPDDKRKNKGKAAEKRKNERKEKVVVESDEQDEERHAKKRRGRKDQDEEEDETPPKKKRGRPPKIKPTPKKTVKRIETSDEEDAVVIGIDKTTERSRDAHNEHKRDNSHKNHHKKRYRRKSEDSFDEEDLMPLKPRRKESPSTRETKKNGGNKMVSVDSLFEDSENEERDRARSREKSGRRRLESDKKEVKRKDSRKRKKSMSEESGEEYEDDMWEDRPSTSRAGTSKKSEREMPKTSKDLYHEKEKEKKRRRKKAEEKKQREKLEEQVKFKKRHLHDRMAQNQTMNRGLRPEDTSMAVGREEEELFTSRHGSRSNTPSRAPSTVGSRAGSRVGSRAGSPERGYPVREGTSGFDTEKLERKLKYEKLKREMDEEQKKKEKKEKEKRAREEKEKNESGGGNIAVPVNPNEKTRTKPKVWIKTGRSAGVEDMPQSLPVPRVIRNLPSNGAKGGGGGGGGVRGTGTNNPVSLGGAPSTSQLDLLDNITVQMNTPLPDAPSVPRVPNAPVVPSPARVRSYAHESVQKKTTSRPTETGGGRGGILRKPCDPRARESTSKAPPPPPAVSSPVPLSVPLSVPHSGSNDHDEAMDYFDTPASPVPDAPESPVAMEVDESSNNFNYAEEDSTPLRDFSRVEGLDQLSEAEKKLKCNLILEQICDNLEKGDLAEVVWALNYKWETLRVCHFDRSANRQFIFELIDSSSPPSNSLLADLKHLARWDRQRGDRQKRLKQSRLHYVHSDAPLTFLTLPSFEERGGRVISKKTPLSVAVDHNKTQWAVFLIKMGSNVNERVYDDEFNGYIINLAMDALPRHNGKNTSMVNLLVAYGANRRLGLMALHEMKDSTFEARPSLTEQDFHLEVPYYYMIEKLMKAAVDSVSRDFQSALRRHALLNVDFQVDWMEDTVCGPPFQTHHLAIEVQEYITPYIRAPNLRELNAIFAVLVGMSPWNVIARNENQRNIDCPQVKDIQFTHTKGQAPFLVYPCGFMPTGTQEEPKMNYVPFQPLQDDMCIYVIPPKMHGVLKSISIFTQEDRVPTTKVVYGGLVRLVLKGQDKSDYRLQEALGRLRGADGAQFNGLY